MISWSTVKSLLIFFGPWLIPWAYAFIKSIREGSSNPQLAIRPVPYQVSRSLNILFTAALFLFVYTLPNFTPENIFRVTRLPLKASTAALFALLGSRRPLTAQDEIIQRKFTSLDNRITYLTHGPDALLSCDFCAPNHPSTYLYYSLPAVMLPHILNGIVMLIATSSGISSREGTRWRVESALASFTFLIADVLLIAAYDPIPNFRAAEENGPIDHFYWRQRLIRFLGLAFLDLGLSAVLYLTSTNRWRAAPSSIAERIENTQRHMEVVKQHLGIMGMLKNSILRDKELRFALEGYWSRAVRESEAEKEDAEVVGALNEVLSSMPLEELERRTTTLAEELVGNIG